MQNEWLPYVLMGLALLCGPVFLTVYALVSGVYDRGFNRGWERACEALGVDPASVACDEADL